MKYIKTIIFLAVMGCCAHGSAQPIQVDTVCCPNERETSSIVTAESIKQPFNNGMLFGNYEYAGGIITKALKVQADSFGCCLMGRYVILYAKIFLEMASNDNVQLKQTAGRMLQLIDTIAKVGPLKGLPDSLTQIAFFKLTTLHSLYIAYAKISGTVLLEQLDKKIADWQLQYPATYSPYEVPYLLVKAYRHINYKDYATALHCINKVFAIQNREAIDASITATAYNTLGLLEYNRGNDAKAISWCDSGLATLAKNNSAILIFNKNILQLPLLMNKGNSLMRLGQLALADSVLGRALLLSKGYNDRTHWVTSRALHNYGTCQMLLGRYDEAFAKITEANQTYFNYLFHYFNSTNDDAKFELLSSIDDAFYALPILLGKQTAAATGKIIHQIYNEQLLLKGFFLKSQGLVKAAILEEKDSTTQRLYKALVATGNEMVQLLQGRKSWSSKKMTAFESQRRDIEEQLYQRSNAFRKTVNQLRVTPQQVQQSLQKGETAIEFIAYKELDPVSNRLTENKRYAAIVSNQRDTAIHYIPLCRESDLLRLFGKAGYSETKDTWLSQLCYNPLKNNTYNMHVDDSIYQYLLKPLVPYLQGARTLYIAPVGLLHLIPFAALSYKGRAPLIDSFAVRIVLTTGSLVDRPAETTDLPRTASLWYNISYGDGTQKEIEWAVGWLGTLSKSLSNINWGTQAGTASIPGIQKKMAKKGIQVSIYQQQAANETVFKQLGSNSTAILHIDTHGFAIPVKGEAQPLATDYAAWQAKHPLFYSGLLLANSKNSLQGGHLTDTAEDGILTAYEVSQMDLRQTRLVVLSACKTGLGPIVDNEGPFGLARAFKIAGAGKVIASLWSVDDKATQELFKHFYHYWLDAKKPVETAFALAQKRMAKGKAYRLPYFWAGFVLIE